MPNTSTSTGLLAPAYGLVNHRAVAARQAGTYLVSRPAAYKNPTHELRDDYCGAMYDWRVPGNQGMTSMASATVFHLSCCLIMLSAILSQHGQATAPDFVLVRIRLIFLLNGSCRTDPLPTPFLAR